MTSPYRRVLIKISGEVFNKTNKNKRYNKSDTDFAVNEIRSIHDQSQIAIVVGGGNIIRGSELNYELETEEVVADQVGMTATLLNALVLQEQLERKFGFKTRVMTSIPMDSFAEPYIRRKALHHLQNNNIVILACGTGNTRVTTDTAAVQKGAELRVDAVLKGTKFALHDTDPVKNPHAKIIRRISRQEFLTQGLDTIMDRSAVVQVEKTKMPIIIFDFFVSGNLLRAMHGEEVGSIIH